ncbi:redoxin domain-containing protein [Bacterioplanoides sp. SCSIO 12839]|uniref:redoxin domain-containing protein n=1 Tax=Bacterioplanoides sp. SCSIO 12839 TaxID=2829569 RepID=UPI002107125A|nr:redoxin domain-containing protein [Bacterioplanoides sp. SCSIO 12839]UTW46810.1 redoxin domain-containing protein [Bacterioplanoides sp. SCSIO 12839]
MKMMWIKSLFISGYLSLAFVTLAWAGYQALQTSSPALLLLSLTALPICAFMGWLFLGNVPRTSANIPQLTLPTIVVSVAAAYQGVAEALPIVPVVAALLVVGALLYVFWYSRFGDRSQSELKLGEKLPQFELQYPDGTTFHSNDSQGQAGLFIFYRGNWCPLCMAQIKEVAAQYQQLELRGVKTYLISSQSHANSEDLAKRFAVSFNFMVDVDNAAAKALKIDAVGGTPAGLQGLGYDSDTVMPTVLMTDAEGKIIFLDQTDNYRVRPEPETFLQILDGKLA